MEKKARSKPMQAIVERLIAFGEFEVEVFGDDVTLHKPIAEWPVCDVLLSWHSDGFPLDKVRAVPTRQAAGGHAYFSEAPATCADTPITRTGSPGQGVGPSALGRLGMRMRAQAAASGGRAQKTLFAHNWVA